MQAACDDQLVAEHGVKIDEEMALLRAWLSCAQCDWRRSRPMFAGLQG